MSALSCIQHENTGAIPTCAAAVHYSHVDRARPAAERWALDPVTVVRNAFPSPTQSKMPAATNLTVTTGFTEITPATVITSRSYSR